MAETRDDLLDRLHEADMRAQTTEARLRIALEHLARARLLAGDLLHEAFCAGHPKTPEWRATYAALADETPKEETR